MEGKENVQEVTEKQMEMVYKRFIETIDSMSDNDLISICNSLNYWNWSSLLGEKPSGWDELPNYKKPHMEECLTKEKLIRPYMAVIRERIPMEKLHRNSVGIETELRFQGFGT